MSQVYEYLRKRNGAAVFLMFASFVAGGWITSKIAPEANGLVYILGGVAAVVVFAVCAIQPDDRQS